MILKLKNINFATMKIQFFLEEVATDGVLVSNKISSGGKNYK